MARTRKASNLPAKVEPKPVGEAPAPMATPIPGGVFGEIGLTGLQHFSGYMDEEFHRELKGDKALKTFEEMQTNDATVGAMLCAVEMALRNVTKRVEPGGDSNEDQQAAELVETALDDMSQSWPDVQSEILTMLPYGFSYHETVYKVRKGQNEDPTTRSQYDDGLFGWRKWAIRGQKTRLRWEMDESGGIQGMWQQVLYGAPGIDYKPRFIPIQKALLFRPRLHKNNPEGRSVLRTAYRTWWFKKRMEEIEGIAIEREGAGLPVIECPASITRSDATADQRAMYNSLKDIVRNVRRDEQAGVVLPQAYDPATNQPLFKLSLLSTGGQRQVNTNEVITRYKQEIVTSILADVILLGQDKVGSFALAGTKKTLFSVALDSWNDQIADVINRHAIPRLLGLNGFRLKKLPQLVFDDVEDESIDIIAETISKLAGAGMALFPDYELEDHLREKLKWPRPTEEEYDAREQERMDAEADKLLQETQIVEQERGNREREIAQLKQPVAKAEAPIVVVTPSEGPRTIDLRLGGPSEEKVEILRSLKGMVTGVKRGDRKFVLKRDAKGHVTAIEPEALSA